MVRLMERKWKSDPEHIIFWGAREKSTGEVVACIGVINSPNYQASYYATGCMHSTQASTPVMVGLIDHWFKTSQSHQIRFLHFGSFWIPGEPKAWKGFSTFKMKFKPQLILYPPTLVRLKCGTFF